MVKHAQTICGQDVTVNNNIETKRITSSPFNQYENIYKKRKRLNLKLLFIQSIRLLIITIKVF